MKKKNNNALIIIGIITLLILVVIYSSNKKEASLDALKLVVSDIPSNISSGIDFSVTYDILGTSERWGVSFIDTITGPCTFNDGTKEYKDVLISIDTPTSKSSTIKVPEGSTGSCTLSVNYKFGTSPTQKITNVISIDPITVPCTDTCSSLNLYCGQSMVCGNIIDCGECNTGRVCVENRCVTPFCGETVWKPVIDLSTKCSTESFNQTLCNNTRTVVGDRVCSSSCSCLNPELVCSGTKFNNSCNVLDACTGTKDCSTTSSGGGGGRSTTSSQKNETQKETVTIKKEDNTILYVGIGIVLFLFVMYLRGRKRR